MEMKKICIYDDEMYPVFFMKGKTAKWDIEVDISLERLEKYEKLWKEWTAMQTWLSGEIEEAIQKKTAEGK